MSDEAEAPVEECKCEKGAPKWMVTFGDMMSLLLCFFVLLLSFSTTDIVKYKKMVGSVKEAFGVAATSPSHTTPSGKRIIVQQIQLPKTFAALVTVRAKANRTSKSESELEMESGADWVRIKVDGDALFESGRFEVKPEAEELLAKIADIINGFNGTISIEGHTDGDPPATTRFEQGSYMGNYELAALRAIAVLNYFVINHSTDKEKLIPVSYGEVKPRELNTTPEGKARNRRVEFEFRTSAQTDFEGVEEKGGTVVKP